MTGIAGSTRIQHGTNSTWAYPAPGRRTVRAVVCRAAVALSLAALAPMQDALAQQSPSADSGAADLLALPALPIPHPRRASADRRAAYSEMLRTWLAPRQAADNVPSSTSEIPRSTTDPQAGSAPDTSKIGAAGAQDPATWTSAEITEAELQCDTLLDGIAAQTDRLASLRQGFCGTPVPLRLRHIGSGTGLALDPTATTNCAMTARLYQWLETVARPAARRLLGQDIVKIRNSASYACRNRYNDPAQKISEHAFANALDIAAFELADGRTIDIKTHWGAVLDSAEAAEAVQSRQDAAKVNEARPRRLDVRAVTSGISEARAADSARSRGAKAVTDITKTAEMTFLEEIHNGACGLFTTVLGPAANAAHRNHFHFDLKSRRGSAYCE